MRERGPRSNVFDYDEDNDHSVTILKKSIAYEYAKAVGDIKLGLDEEVSCDSSLDDHPEAYPYIEPSAPQPTVNVTGATNNNAINARSNDESKSSSWKKYASLLIVEFILFIGLLAISGVYLFDARMNIVKQSQKQNRDDTQEYSQQTTTENARPKSFQNSLYNSKFNELDGDEIPILLDISGTNSKKIVFIMQQCSGLKSVPLYTYLNSLNQNKSLQFDYLTANSLCSLHHNNIKYYHEIKFKIFLLIQNPLTRLLQNYIEINDPTSPRYNTWMVNQDINSFDEYINWSFQKNHNNIVTRSILCKMKGRLTTVDFNNTRTFLKNNAHVGNYINYNNTISLLFDKWNNNEKKSSINQCIKKHFNKLSIDQSRLLHMHDTNEDLLLRIYRVNYYDYNIYLDYVNM